MWCVAELDEEYVEKMEDVLAVYEKELSSEEPVVCLDEKSVTLHKDVREPLPMKPGSVAKRDYEYERCGAANVFCAVEPKAGVHFTKATPNRSGAEFAEFVRSIGDHYRDAVTIHLVLDNLNTHYRKTLVERFGEDEGNARWARFTVHYTPTHGSWLNQAEIEISLFSRQCLGTRRIGDLPSLRRETRAWSRRMNRKRVRIAWKFDRKQARRKFGYKYKSKRSET
jgi:transposase